MFRFKITKSNRPKVTIADKIVILEDKLKKYPEGSYRYNQLWGKIQQLKSGKIFWEGKNGTYVKPKEENEKEGKENE